MNYTPIFNIAAICYNLGVRDVVISPGGRNTPLIVSFNRHPTIKTYVVNDERAAAFIALGMAQKSKSLVVITATSGSAAYNYAPAITEAYFQQIPLLILTADRSQEWIDQQDGQTIYQSNIFGHHVKKSFQSPIDIENKDSAWHLERIISDAINLSKDGAMGPTHINIPFREPFYPTQRDKPNYSSSKTISTFTTSKHLSNLDWANLLYDWNKYNNRLIIVGQNDRSSDLLKILEKLKTKSKIPIIGEVISNTHAIAETIKSHDIFIAALNKNDLDDIRPDLLISFGKSVLSKNLKKYLRTYRPKAHWHIQQDGIVADTFQSLTRIIPLTPISFFNYIYNHSLENCSEYNKRWIKYQIKTHSFIQKFHNKEEFNEFSFLYTLFKNLPICCDIHLSNSMPVRYATIIGLSPKNHQVELFCNRGTSGIDGCTSTSVGSALKTKKITLLITGDMAFFYDRNAFWHHHIPNNLRIILLNNHGGGIFNLIDGTNNLLEKEKFLITNQPLTAKNLASEFNLEYHHTTTGELPPKGKFWESSKQAKILEIETSITINTKIFKKFKQEAKQLWNQPTLGKV